MEVYYINHKNQKIDLGKSPYQMQVGEMFNSSNKYEGSNFKITRIHKEITTIPTVVTIDAPTEQAFCEAVNKFFEITETDTVAGVQGKLFIGEYYLLCNIIASSKTFWQEMFNGVENAVKILTPYPYWCHELKKSFHKRSAAVLRSTEEFLSYPFMYPYKYSTPDNVEFVENDHYSDCDFRMYVYGPCENPAIRINEHLYEVSATLLDGEYLLIDSRNNTVHRYLSDGRTVNLFNWRKKDSDLFKKIPSGRNSVIWNNTAFGFDLTLFQERSEPKWTL